MAFYIGRKILKKAPAEVIRNIKKPHPELIEGFGSRARVGEICKLRGFKRVLVVTDSNIYKLGFHNVVLDSLKSDRIEFSVFSDINSEPTVSIIKAGRKEALLCEADCIIALGGGSVMDSGKMMAAWVKKPKIRVCTPKFIFGQTLPMINIPTTAGTGAEMTVGAVVKKRENGPKNATVIVGLDVDTVILDSELTINSPDSVTMACAIDALSHGLEGAVGDVKVSEDDKVKSFECVKIVLDNLLKLKEDPRNKELRQAMCLAALYGGNAINKQLAGYVHAFAHSIGAKYHLPHGVAIAYCLYPIMKFQQNSCRGKLEELAPYCGYKSSDELLEAVHSLIVESEVTKDKLEIPKSDYRKLKSMILLDSINYSEPMVFKASDIYHLLDVISNK